MAGEGRPSTTSLLASPKSQTDLSWPGDAGTAEESSVLAVGLAP
jgi:hypothetical protein